MEFLHVRIFPNFISCVPGMSREDESIHTSDRAVRYPRGRERPTEVHITELPLRCLQVASGVPIMGAVLSYTPCH